MPTDDDILESLRAAGFLPAGVAANLERLTGGVSSDVYRLTSPGGPVCVKRALAKLRVAADWRAPVERSHFEVEWLRVAREFAGDAVPRVLFEDQAASLFVMSYFDPASHSVWKSDLAAGRTDQAFAGQVGALLARIHSGLAHDQDVAARFETLALFEDLRLAPYLRHTALAHPDLSARLIGLADETAKAKITLVHGDVSPKNMLHGPEGPVLLDAECAWYGDPAFDLAFCSAHLLLKTVWKPAFAADLMADLDALIAAYRAGVDWEDVGGLDRRAAALTAALVLARVDGKSPVEYLDSPTDRTFVRNTARRLIVAGDASMADLAADWKRAIAAR